MSLFDRIRSPLSAAGGDARTLLVASGPTIAAFVLVLLIAAQLASLAWRLYASPAESADQAPVAADTADGGVGALFREIGRAPGRERAFSTV